MSLPFKLYRLQQIDSHHDRVAARMGEIQKQLSADEALQEAMEREHAAKLGLEKARKNLLIAEENVKEQRIKIETSESALYGGRIRNPKELQDLQNEIASLKRFLSVLEDRQLETMIALDEADQNYQAALSKLNNEQQRYNENQKALIGENGNLQSESGNILAERQAAANSLGKEELNLYEGLRKQRNGIAVAKIVNKACSACGSTLNASLLQAASITNQVSRCDTCGRILYSA
jgi:uncharacterized protein